MASLGTGPGADAVRVKELAEIGAGRAASAFAVLLGRELRARAARVGTVLEPGRLGREAIGVVFEMQGSLRGLIALVLTRGARDAVLEALGAPPDAGAERAESALSEVGNIVASQAVSAVADHLGGRITLTLPLLVHEDAVRAVGSLLNGAASRLAAHSELRDSAGDARALLVFAPRHPADPAI